MIEHPAREAVVSCLNSRGLPVAALRIRAGVRQTKVQEPDLLWILAGQTAHVTSEEPRVHLRERTRYEYQLIPTSAAKHGLRIVNNPLVTPNAFDPRSGAIETRDYCGLLVFQIVHVDDPEQRVVARAEVEVRSVKVDYRTQYRDMLTSIAERATGLLLDARVPTKLRLETVWQKANASLEQQLEFLRCLLESNEFYNAVEQVLRNPHRQLKAEDVIRPITRPGRFNRLLVRQFVSACSRLEIPDGHPLGPHLSSVPKEVTILRRCDNYDTAENRFVVRVLRDFRDFFVQVERYLVRSDSTVQQPNNRALLRQVESCRSRLTETLQRSFFPDISEPTSLPLGSPVLQRRAGYRDLLRYWLQFNLSVQLVWEGGAEVFHAGSRDVAALYEYWLFFQLESLLRTKFTFDQPLHAVIIDRSSGLPRLNLKRGCETTLCLITSNDKCLRNLRARFSFNRQFARTRSSRQRGSWSRRVRPDYTLSIWPAEFGEGDAEGQELMVHLHFDAKYRVDHLQEIFGGDDDEVFDEERAEDLEKPTTAAKYADLLKMHAYRDAIRRTAGAYVLYPGEPGDGRLFQGYHEILPGLGAFAVTPSPNGQAAGIGQLSRFLDEVLAHLSARITARERLTYHMSEIYAETTPGIDSGSLEIPERAWHGNKRALPPAEHLVLMAWFKSPQHLAWSLEQKRMVVRLGHRRGTLRILPDLGAVQHILLHTENQHFEPGLWRLTEPGFNVWFPNELKRYNYPSEPGGRGYAVFNAEPDSAFATVIWLPMEMTRLLSKFHAEQSGRLRGNIGRFSPFPAIVTLADLLQTI